MKTAMQELLEKIEQKNGKEFTSYYLEFIDEALKEEKEQIVDAYRIASINNAPNEDMQNIKPEYWQVNAELWYDKHYNQNK